MAKLAKQPPRKSFCKAAFHFIKLHVYKKRIHSVVDHHFHKACQSADIAFRPESGTNSCKANI